MHFNHFVNEATAMVQGNKKRKWFKIAYSRWVSCSHGVILFLELVTVIVNT